jgi:hypothetical protein
VDGGEGRVLIGIDRVVRTLQRRSVPCIASASAEPATALHRRSPIVSEVVSDIEMSQSVYCSAALRRSHPTENVFGAKYGNPH